MPLEYKGSLSRYRRYLQTVREKPLVRAGLWVIFSLVLTITMIITALKPTLTTIASLTGQIEQAQTLSARLDDKIRQVQTAQENLGKITGQLGLLDTAIPARPQWDLLTGKLQDAATSSGIKLQLLAANEIAIAGNVISQTANKTSPADMIILPSGTTDIKWSLTASGTYPQLRDFVKRVENFRRLFIPTSTSIDKNSKGDLILNMSGFSVYEK